MSDPTVLPSVRLAAITVSELLGVILQSASVSPHIASASIGTKLKELAQSDKVFADWFNTSCAFDLDDTDRFDALVKDLPERLLPHLESLPTDSPDRANLFAAAHLAIQRRAQQTQFARELELQKTEAIYNFAYGLSHELNNPLANISTRAGVLLQDCDQPEQATLLRAIVDAAMRGGEMLGDLMLLARPPALEWKRISWNSLLSELVRDCQAVAALRDITIILEVETASETFLDPLAFREALWALLRNSIEASDPQQSVRIRCECSTNACLLTIIDGGPGIPPEMLTSCFDPYFSGREAGRGLGMGLAKARKIIDLHGGTIELGNIPGGGCQVQICLPLRSEAPQLDP